jgi:hypothetical protein
VAHANPKDQRLMAFAEVRDLTPVRDDAGQIVALPQLERVLLDALEGMRRVQAPLPPARRYQWNRVLLYVWPPFDLTDDEVDRVARSLVPATLGLGIEEVGVRCRRPDPASGALRERLIRLVNPTGTEFIVVDDDLPTEPLLPLDEYTQKVVQSRCRVDNGQPSSLGQQMLRGGKNIGNGPCQLVAGKSSLPVGIDPS